MQVAVITRPSREQDHHIGPDPEACVCHCLLGGQHWHGTARGSHFWEGKSSTKLWKFGNGDAVMRFINRRETQNPKEKQSVGHGEE